MNPEKLAARLVIALSLVAGCSAPAAPLPVAPATSPHELRAATGEPAEHAAAAERAVARRPAPDPGTAVPVLADDPAWGDPLAPVTLVVWGDYECPFTGKMMRTTLPALEDHYGAGRLRVVWKHFPLTFHQNAQPAHEAAVAVLTLGGPTAFWKFHQLTFERQDDLSPRALEESALSAGVDVASFRSAIASGQLAHRVQADIELGKKNAVTGTPASFINGVYLSGAQPIEKFRAIIDAELVRAEATRREGVPPERLYATVSERYRAEHPIQPRDPTKPIDSTTVWKVPVRGAPMRGNPDALVTLVMFASFQCPFCKKSLPTVEGLERKYGDRLRVVFMHEPLPFHERAEPAAQLAIEARVQKGDRAFFAAASLLFENQKHLEDADLEGYAATLQLDVERVRRAIAKHAHAKVLERDRDLADDLAASGTPHFFINGRRLVGAQPPAKFEAIIDEEIARAESLLVSGTPKKKIYDALQRDAKGPPPWERIIVPAPTRDQPAKGAKPGAKLVVQFFSDFQCPFCRKAAPMLDEIIAAYPGKVRIVWRHNPLSMHKDAVLAAEAAMEAFAQKGDDGFWAMAKLLYAAEGPDALGREALERMGAAAGLDRAKLALAMDQHTHRAAIDADLRLGQSLGVTGTPTFAIGDYYVSGAQTFTHLKRRIDKALGPHEPPTPDTIHKVTPPAHPLPAPVAAATAIGAKHLLIIYREARRAPPGVTRSKDEARALALSLRARLQGGAVFEDLVTKYSDEPGAAARGGDLGTFPKGAMVPEFERAVEALGVGDTSDVIETPFGFHLIVRTK